MKLPRTIGLVFVGGLLLCTAAARAQSVVSSVSGLFDSAHYSEAESVARAEISKSDHQADLYYWMGRCSFELHDDDAAESNAEHAVQLDPDNSEYHDFLGVAAGHKAQFANWFAALALAKKAQHEFMEAVRLDSRNTRAHRDLIAFDVAAPGFVGGGEDKAQDEIAKLAAVDPVQADLARINFYENKKNWESANEQAEAVIAAKPREVDPYIEVASYYERREDPAGIRTAIAAMPKSAAPNPHIAYYRGVADFLAGDDLVESEASLKAYFQSPPPRREDLAPLSAAHTWLGRLYEKLGRRDSAEQEYRSALDLDSKDKTARDGLKRLGGS
jgi:tetratricopeptide (TPR) repeat protein